MKKNKDEINTTGYIEGYYGKLLSWDNRKLIVKSLQKNNMNTYFYAPKEDENHRLNWREKYNLKWRKDFREFTKFSKTNNINVIAGIAPGLDFDFKKFNDRTKNKKSGTHSQQRIKIQTPCLCFLHCKQHSSRRRQHGAVLKE